MDVTIFNFYIHSFNLCFMFKICPFDFNFLISRFYPLNLLLFLLLLLLFRSDTNQEENIISYEKFV